MYILATTILFKNILFISSFILPPTISILSKTFILFHFISFHFISFHFILFYFILFYFIPTTVVPLIINILFIYLNVFLLATIVQIHLTLQSGIREYGASGKKSSMCVCIVILYAMKSFPSRHVCNMSASHPCTISTRILHVQSSIEPLSHSHWTCLQCDLACAL